MLCEALVGSAVKLEVRLTTSGQSASCLDASPAQTCAYARPDSTAVHASSILHQAAIVPHIPHSSSTCIVDHVLVCFRHRTGSSAHCTCRPASQNRTKRPYCLRVMQRQSRYRTPLPRLTTAQSRHQAYLRRTKADKACSCTSLDHTQSNATSTPPQQMCRSGMASQPLCPGVLTKQPIEHGVKLDVRLSSLRACPLRPGCTAMGLRAS